MKPFFPRSLRHVVGLTVFAGSLLVRLGALVRMESSPFFDQNRGDSAYYLGWAARIAEGIWTDGKAFYGLPLYPFCLAGWQTAFGDPVWPGLLINAVADALLAFVIFETVLRIIAGDLAEGAVPPLVAAGAAAAWIFFRPAAALAASLMPNTLAVLAFWLVVRRLVAPAPLAAAGRALSWGAFLGFGSLLSANLLFLFPLLGWKATRPPWATAAGRLALLALGVALGAAPAWTHNYFAARDPVFLSAHSGINFFIGNHAGANGYPRFPPGLRSSQEGMLQDSIRVAEKEAGRPLLRSEVSAYWTAQARTYIREHPAEWLALLGRKVRNYWSAFQYDDIAVITPLREWGVIWPGLSFGCLVLFGLPGLLWGAWRYPAARWIAAALGLHLASLLPVFVTERYRLCAGPALCIGLGLGAWFLMRALAQRSWAALTGGAAGVAAAGALAFWPLGLDGLAALDDLNMARVLLEEDRMAEALPRLERAAAAGPNDSGVNFLFGNYWMKLRNFPAAKASYRRVLLLDPTHAGAWNNSALIALEEQNWEVAERFLLHALPGSSDPAKVWYLLARSRLGAGDLPGATDAIRRALQARPDQPQFLALRAEIESRSASPSLAP